ncbi:MAG: CBS domain-containing protein [Clostridia bacterium]|nr:CBS domain-containing protein [Clostridia bacterium]
MDICEAFLDAYRNLEEVLAAKYGQKMGTVQMYAQGEGSAYFEELSLFREMRNLLSHHGRINGAHAVLPSEASLNKLLEILEYAKHPPMAMYAATPASKLCCARLTDSISFVLETMEKRGYSHIPVLNKRGGLYGVFSVGTLFALAKENPKRSVDGMTLADIAAHLPAEKHTTEKFEFVNRDASLYEIKGLFKAPGPYHRRVAAVFVTESGSSGSKLCGMITPWDVFKAEER